MRVCEEPHKAFGRYENVFLTDAEYAELQNDFPDRLERFVEEMSRYLAAALRIWAADGLLYCGKCHTLKEACFPEGRTPLGVDRHPAECDCQRPAREDREAAEQRRRYLDTVEELKKQPINGMLWTHSNSAGDFLK